MSSPSDHNAPERLSEVTTSPPPAPHAQPENEVSDSIANHSHVRKLLYTSHFLSAWNSRLFEFGAFLFLANIFPNTLLPASTYALARAASAAILSPVLGCFIDKANRLAVVRLSIGKSSCTVNSWSG
jgi:hypothetical protein